MDRGLIHASPVIDQGVVYTTSADSTLYAIDALTGQQKWTYKLGAGETIGQPVVHKGIIYLRNSSQNLVAIDLTSHAKKWEFTPNLSGMYGGVYMSNPAVTDGFLFVGSNVGSFAIDPESGKPKWSIPLLTTFWPTIADGVIYVCDLDSRLYALDLQTGAQQWLANLGVPLNAATVLSKNGVVNRPWGSGY